LDGRVPDDVRNGERDKGTGKIGGGGVGTKFFKSPNWRGSLRRGGGSLSHNNKQPRKLGRSGQKKGTFASGVISVQPKAECVSKGEGTAMKEGEKGVKGEGDGKKTSGSTRPTCRPKTILQRGQGSVRDIKTRKSRAPQNSRKEGGEISKRGVRSQQKEIRGKKKNT